MQNNVFTIKEDLFSQKTIYSTVYSTVSNQINTNKGQIVFISNIRRFSASSSLKVRQRWAGSEGQFYLARRAEGRPFDYSVYVKVRTEPESWTLHEKVTMDMKRKIICEDKNFLHWKNKWTNSETYDFFYNRYHVGDRTNPKKYMEDYLKNTYLEDIQIFHNPLDTWTVIAVQERFNCTHFYTNAGAFNLTTIFGDPASHPSNTTSGLSPYTAPNLPAPTNTTIGPNYQTAVLPSVNSTTSGPSNTTGSHDTMSLSNILNEDRSTTGPGANTNGRHSRILSALSNRRGGSGSGTNSGPGGFGGMGPSGSASGSASGSGGQASGSTLRVIADFFSYAFNKSLAFLKFIAEQMDHFI